MAETAQDLAGADEFRSPKKLKGNDDFDITGQVKEEIINGAEEDWDDIYGVDVGDEATRASAVELSAGGGTEAPINGEAAVSSSEGKEPEDVQTMEPTSKGRGTLPLAPPGEHTRTEQAQSAERTEDGLPAAMIDPGDELVDSMDSRIESTDEASTRMIEEMTELDVQPQPQRLASTNSDRTVTAEVSTVQQIDGLTSHPTKDDRVTETIMDAPPTANGQTHHTESADEDTTAYLATLAANRDDPNAEVAQDSEAGSSDDSDDSDDSSDSSDDDVEELTPAMIEQMLQGGEEGVDEGGEGGGACS
jgi:hypothetical protein